MLFMSCRAGLGQHRPGTLHVALTATGAAALKLSSAAAAAKPVSSPASVSPIPLRVWLAAVTSLFVTFSLCASVSSMPTMKWMCADGRTGMKLS